MRALPVLLLPLLLAGPARAFDEDAALRLLNGGQRAHGGCTLVAPWGEAADGLRVVALAQDDDVVRVAVMRERDGAPVIVAGPEPVEVIRMDPLGSACTLQLEERSLLGGRPLIALRVSNSGLTTGRSSFTIASHFLLRNGDSLRAVFASLGQATHSEQVGRRRVGWHLAYRVAPAPARPGRMPDLLVRDVRTGRIVLRARWQGERYAPPLFERFGSVRG